MPIRLRLTLVVAAVTIVLVGLAGLLGPRVLRASLVAAIDEHLVQRSRPILVVVTDPDDTTVDQEDLRDEVAGSPDSFVQVLDPSGGLLASSPGLPTRPLVPAWVLARLTTTGPVGFEQSLDGGGGERVRMLAMSVDRPDGRYVVAVGSSLATTEAALDRVRTGVGVGGVVVVLLASLGAWLLAGAALRPVERLRAAVAAVLPTRPARPSRCRRPGTSWPRLARTMNQLLGRISQALERERRLIADASHELRSPLAVLRTELELANQPGRRRSELAESVRHAAREADRAARLAEDLLFLARTDQGGPNVHPVHQPLHPVLAGAATAAGGRAAAARIRLELDIDTQLELGVGVAGGVGGVGGHLGAVQRDHPEADQPGGGAQPQRGDQEPGQGLLVPHAEARDGHVVGELVAGQHPPTAAGPDRAPSYTTTRPPTLIPPGQRLLCWCSVVAPTGFDRRYRLEREQALADALAD